jgi:hypothetical protein
VKIKIIYPMQKRLQDDIYKYMLATGLNQTRNGRIATPSRRKSLSV